MLTYNNEKNRAIYPALISILQYSKHLFRLYHNIDKEPQKMLTNIHSKKAGLFHLPHCAIS